MTITHGSATYAGRHILLVEDQAIIAMAEQAMLERRGYRVTTAATAEAATSAVRELDVDLVLMDIDLGDNAPDGTDAARTILSFADVPIVFLSNHTEPEVVERTEAITSYGYVVKNSGETVIDTSIKMAFRLHEAHQSLQDHAERLAESEMRYRALYANAPIPYQSLDDEGVLNDINPAWAAALGYDREDVIGRSFAEFLDDASRQTFGAAFPEFKRRGSVSDVRFQMRRRDGTYRTVSFEGRVGYRTDGTFLRTYCVFEDITEREAAKHALEASEERFRQLFNGMSEGVAIYRAVRDGADFEIVDMNAAGLELGGVRHDDVVGRLVTEAFPAVKEIGLFEAFQAVYRTGESRSHPLRNYRDGRIELWVENTVFALPSGLIVAIYNDTTGQRQIEAEYAAVVDQSMDGWWRVDASGRILGANRAYAEMSGYEIDELVGKHVSDVDARESRDDSMQHMERLLSTGGDRFESVHRRADGSVFPVEINTVSVARGSQREVIAFVRDLCERRRSNERVQFLARVLEAVGEAVIVTDLECTVLYMNRPAEQLYGWRTDEAVGKDLADLSMRPSSRARATEYMEAVRRGETVAGESFVRDKAGHEFTTRVTSSLIRDEDGRPSGILQISHKIHPGPPAGEILADDHYLKRELYERIQSDPTVFDFLQNGSLDGIWYWDLDNPEHEWLSSRFWQTLGFEPAEQPHLASAWQDLIHPDDLRVALRNLELHLKDPGHPYDQIVRYRHRDGSTVWVRCRGIAIRDEDGTPRRMLGAHNEITELKVTEAELSEKVRALDAAGHERELLLREFNHRAKNNFAIIKSLVEIKQASVGEAVDLADLGHRIEAFRIVHELLQLDGDTGAIEAGTYFDSLLRSIFDPAVHPDVKVETAIDRVRIAARTVPPLGLIVNELALNALKHGFSRTDEKRIRLGLSRLGDSRTIELSFSSTGPEIPRSVDLDNPSSLGLRLVTALVAQVDGTMDVDRKSPPTFTIRFPQA